MNRLVKITIIEILIALAILGSVFAADPVLPDPGQQTAFGLVILIFFTRWFIRVTDYLIGLDILLWGPVERFVRNRLVTTRRARIATEILYHQSGKWLKWIKRPFKRGVKKEAQKEEKKAAWYDTKETFRNLINKGGEIFADALLNLVDIVPQIFGVIGKALIIPFLSDILRWVGYAAMIALSLFLLSVGFWAPGALLLTLVVCKIFGWKAPVVWVLDKMLKIFMLYIMIMPVWIVVKAYTTPTVTAEGLVHLTLTLIIGWFIYDVFVLFRYTWHRLLRNKGLRWFTRLKKTGADFLDLYRKTDELEMVYTHAYQEEIRKSRKLIQTQEDGVALYLHTLIDAAQKGVEVTEQQVIEPLVQTLRAYGKSDDEIKRIMEALEVLKRTERGE
jgi:hypothetical protein